MKPRRSSRQQELIYQFLCHTTEHPTAEMVYQALKPQLPNLSLGTVYRNLNRFCEEGKLRRVRFAVERYDCNLSPHAHFCCQRCGQVSDLMPDQPVEIDRTVSRQYGHQVQCHELVCYGICAACLQEQGQEAEQSSKEER